MRTSYIKRKEGRRDGWMEGRKGGSKEGREGIGRVAST